MTNMELRTIPPIAEEDPGATSNNASNKKQTITIEEISNFVTFTMMYIPVK